MDGLEKGFDFEAERLARGDLGFVHAQRGESRWYRCRLVRLPDAAGFLRGEV